MHGRMARPMHNTSVRACVRARARVCACVYRIVRVLVKACVCLVSTCGREARKGHRCWSLPFQTECAHVRKRDGGLREAGIPRELSRSFNTLPRMEDNHHTHTRTHRADKDIARLQRLRRADAEQTRRQGERQCQPLPLRRRHFALHGRTQQGTRGAGGAGGRMSAWVCVRRQRTQQRQHRAPPSACRHRTPPTAASALGQRASVLKQRTRSGLSTIYHTERAGVGPVRGFNACPSKTNMSRAARPATAGRTREAVSRRSMGWRRSCARMRGLRARWRVHAHANGLPLVRVSRSAPCLAACACVPRGDAGRVFACMHACACVRHTLTLQPQGERAGERSQLAEVYGGG